MAYTVCPHCRQAFELPEAPLYPAAWEAAERRQFAAGASELAGVGELMRETPTRPADPLADVFVPLLQAVICAGAAAMVTAIFADSWRLPAVVGVATFALAWVTLLRLSIARLSVKEHVIKQPEGEAPAPYVTRLAFSLDGFAQEHEVKLPPDKLLSIARACSNGRPFSEAEWSGRGRLLSGRREYHLLRDAFLSMGWARWKDENAHAQGVEFTASGRAALKALASGKIRPEQLEY